MVNLRELERFIMSNYVSNVDMVDDVLGDLLDRNPDPDEKNSILLLTDVINRLSLLKSKGLWERVTELQVERLIRNCMCLQDQNDFFVEEAKYFTEGQVRDGEEELSLEEWFLKEMSRDNPIQRKHFLLKFMRMKLAVLLDREASRRMASASGNS